MAKQDLVTNVWRTPFTEFLISDPKPLTKRAIEDMANQLGVDYTYDWRGTADGSYDKSMSYGELQDEFRANNSLDSGEFNILIYYRDATDPDHAGQSQGSYKQGNTPSSVVNFGVVGYVSATAYRNTVMHEMGHLMLTESGAPADTGSGYNAEHSYGVQYTPGTGRETSPMTTWYTGQYGNAGETPPVCCGGDDIKKAAYHNAQMSSCSVSDMTDWLSNSY
jgi:hypothetical protein